jgi:hypothetical protein
MPVSSTVDLDVRSSATASHKEVLKRNWKSSCAQIEQRSVPSLLESIAQLRSQGCRSVESLWLGKSLALRISSENLSLTLVSNGIVSSGVNKVLEISRNSARYFIMEGSGKAVRLC